MMILEASLHWLISLVLYPVLMLDWFIHRWGRTGIDKNVIYGTLQAQSRADEWSVPDSCIWCGSTWFEVYRQIQNTHWGYLNRWQNHSPQARYLFHLLTDGTRSQSGTSHGLSYPRAWPFCMPGQAPGWNRATPAKIRWTPSSVGAEQEQRRHTRFCGWWYSPLNILAIDILW